MRRKMLVKVRTSGSLLWPQSCALCLKTATEEDATTVLGDKIPYCSPCYARVQRLRSWKDHLFAISLVIGAIFGVLSLVGLVGEEGWLALLRSLTYLKAMGGAMIFGGIAYGLMWVGMLPLRLIFRSSLSPPGVREVKSKDPGVRRLRFAAAEYAKRFREDNAGMVLG